MANDIGGVWRTVGGHKVFIKNGQDLSSAMNENKYFKEIKKENKNTKLSERKSDDVLVIKNNKSTSKKNTESLKKEKIDVDEYLKSDEVLKQIKEYANSDEIPENARGTIKICEPISKKVTSMLKDKGVNAETIQVSVIAEGKPPSITEHFVTEANGKLYDFTGTQYLKGKTSKDIELRIYKKIDKGFYAEKDIKNDKKLSNEEKVAFMTKYTKNNPNNLILYKDTNYQQINPIFSTLNKLNNNKNNK